MAINDSTNKYTSNVIVVDAAGTTPFTTIQQGITAATDLGLTDVEIYIRPGTYTENLNLVSSFNLTGSSYLDVIIEGTHVIPIAGSITCTNIRFNQATPATDIFTENGASSCQCRFVRCYFYPDSGASFNIPTSTGLINLYNCNGSAVTSDSVFNNAASASFYLIDSYMGKGAVACTSNGNVLIRGSWLYVPLTLSGAAVCQYFYSSQYNSITLSDTASLYMGYSSITTANTPITVNAGTRAVLSNLIVDSAAANIVTGAGSCQYNEVTCLNSSAHNATTETYSSRVITGSLQLDEANAGVPYFTAGVMGSTAALTDGQLVVGSTGNLPALATITAGAGTTVTNGAGSITIGQTAGFPFTFTSVAVDGALVTNTAYVNDKAALLTMSLPATSAKGDVIILQGYGATGWKITQAANQQILVGNTNTTLGAGGTLSSSDKGDSVSMVCTTANLEWRVFGMVGNLTIV